MTKESRSPNAQGRRASVVALCNRSHARTLTGFGVEVLARYGLYSTYAIILGGI